MNQEKPVRAVPTSTFWLRWLRPKTFRLARTIRITDQGREYLRQLEAKQPA